MYPLELQAKINEWRTRAASGEMTEEEAIEAIAALRGGNRAAAAVGSVKAKASKAKPDVDNLLDQLKGL